VLAMTLALAAASIAGMALFYRGPVTPGHFYWAGWLLATISAVAMEGQGIMPRLSPRTSGLLIPFHMAAGLGFVAGTAIGVFGTALLRPRHPVQRELKLHLHLALVSAAFVLHAAVGVVSLAYRAAQMGGFGALLNLGAVRRSFIESAHMVTTLPLPVRIGNHLAIALSVMPFLFAVADALKRRPNFGRIGLWWILMIPSGLASGGRGWIIAAPLTYGVTYLMVLGVGGAVPTLRRSGLRIAMAFGLLVATFSYIQIARTEAGDAAITIFQNEGDARWPDYVPVLKPVLFYFGIPLLGIVEYSDFVSMRPPSNGALIFPLLSETLVRSGVVKESREFEYLIEGRRYATLGADPLLGQTHATTVPRFVGDFGLDAYTWAFAIVACWIQVLYICIRDMGVVGRLAAVQLLLYGGFWVAQDFMLGLSGIILPVVWLALLLQFGRVLRDSGLIRDDLIKLSRSGARASRSREVPSRWASAEPSYTTDGGSAI
jgi:hypothetical protein